MTDVRELGESRLGEGRPTGADDDELLRGPHVNRPDSTVDEWLPNGWRELLPTLNASSSGRVVAFSQFQSIPDVACVPFDLCLKYPDAVSWLPLTSDFTVIPLRPATLQAREYRIRDALECIRKARWARHEQNRAQPDDLLWPDWEEGAKKHRSRIEQLALAPHSFVRVDRVMGSGKVNSLPRPVLGRHAARRAPTPRVLVPGPGDLSPPAVAKLADTKLLLIDLQHVRGRRILAMMEELLRTRGADRPAVVVIHSPSDLLATGLEPLLDSSMVSVLGSPPTVREMFIRQVSPERLAADEAFVATVRDLEGQDPVADRLIALARTGWWALRQSVDADGGLRELRRFERALEETQSRDPFLGSLFTACRELLASTAADEERRQERLAAIVDGVSGWAGTGSISVLTRDRHDAESVSLAISSGLNVAPEDLRALGVSVRSVYSASEDRESQLVVVAGYAGMVTLDAVLGSRAPSVLVVWDPVEARTAWHHLRQMVACLERLKAEDSAAVLRLMAEAIKPSVVGFGEVRDLELDSEWLRVPTDHATRQRLSSSPDEVVIRFEDGFETSVPPGTRFEVFRTHHHRPSVLLAKDLQSGDEVVLLDDDARAEFSRRRMTLLDTGVLRAQWGTRQAWLVLTKAVVEKRGLRPVAIARAMGALGYAVTPSAVGAWLREDPDEASAPSSLDGFVALARVIGLDLPADVLRHYHEEIHAWRVRHRKAGREVAQAIRLARTGRLGAVTLSRIEKEWGVGVRDLVMAAHVGVVDDIVLPDEEAYHA